MGVGWSSLLYKYLFFSLFCPSIYVILFLHSHWDLEKRKSDWDEIWHELLEWVG